MSLFILLLLSNIFKNEVIYCTNVKSIPSIVSKSTDSFHIEQFDAIYYVKNSDDLLTPLSSNNGISPESPFLGFYEAMTQIDLKLQNKTDQTIIIYLMDNYFHLYSVNSINLFYSLKNIKMFILPYYLNPFLKSGDSDDIISNCLNYIGQNQSKKVRLNIFQENFQININGFTLIMINLEFYGMDFLIKYNIKYKNTSFTFENIISNCFNNFNGCCLNSENFNLTEYCKVPMISISRSTIANKNNYTLFRSGIESENISISCLLVISCSFNHIISISEYDYFYANFIDILLYKNNSILIIFKESIFDSLYFSEGILITEMKVFDSSRIKAFYKVFISNSTIMNYNLYNITESDNVFKDDIIDFSPILLKFQYVQAELNNITVSNGNDFALISSSNLSIISSDFFVSEVSNNYFIVFSDSLFQINMSSFSNSNDDENGSFNANSIFFNFQGENNILTLNDISYNSISVETIFAMNSTNTIIINNTIFSNIYISALFNLNSENFLSINNVFIDQTIQLALRKGQIIGLIILSKKNNIVFSLLHVSNAILLENNFIFVDQSNIIFILDSIFENINPLNMNSMMIFLNNNQIFFKNITLILTTSLKLLESNSLKIEDSYFMSTYSSSNEGGTFTLETKNSIEIYNSNFYNNSSPVFGGMLYIATQNNVSIILSDFQDLESQCYGGIMYASSSNNISFENCSFLNIASRLEGGAFYIFSMNILNFKFCSCSYMSSLYASGGMFYLEENNTLNLMYSQIDNAFAVKSGGFLISSRYNLIDISYTNMTDCQSLFGGAFYIDQSTNISNSFCLFTNISTKRSGGVYFVQSLSVISIYSCNFSKTKSNFSGGVIYLDFQNIFQIENSFIVDSSSKDQPGGAFYFCQLNQALIKNNYFYYVRSEVDAGSIYFVNFNNFQFINNIINCSHSIWEGGSVSFSFGNTGSFEQSLFVNSSSENKGGTIYFDVSNVIIITFCNFSNSQSYELGGVFYFSEFNTVFINSSIILDCSSESDSIVLYAELSNQVQIVNIILKNITMQLQLEKENFNFYMSYEEYDFQSAKVNVFERKSMFYLKDENDFFIYQSNFNSLSAETLIISCNSVLYIDSSIFKNILTKFNLIINFFFVNPQEIIFQNITISGIISPNILFISNTPLLLKRINYVTDTIDPDLFLKVVSSSNCRIINSNFLKKEIALIGSQYAGFIEAKDSILKIKRCYFINGKGINGGAIYIEQTNLTISSSFFIFNEAENYGGGVYNNITGYFSTNSESFKISRTISIFNYAKTGVGAGGFIAIINEILKINITNQTNKSVTIQKSILKFNRALSLGGVFYFMNLKGIFIKNSKINDNFVGSYFCNTYNNKTLVRGKGGVITINTNLTDAYQNLLESYDITLELLNCSFNNNRAFIGGTIFWLGSPLILNTNDIIFYNNIAYDYGHTLASNIHSFNLSQGDLIQNISILENENLKILKIYNITSGHNYENCLAIISPLDFYNQIANYTTEDYEKNFTDSGYLNFVRTNFGFYCIKGIFSKTTKNNNEITFTINFDKNKLFHSKPIQIYIYFRQCLMGERLTEDFNCVECSPNFYSFIRIFDNPTELCKSCENEVFNCYGGNRLTPKPGFWRISAESDNFLKCPNSDSCLGDSLSSYSVDFMTNLTVQYDESLALGKCSKGYQGVLCAECSLGYGRDVYKPNQCSECATGFQICLFIFLMILRTGFILWSINEAIQMCITISSDNPDINKVITNNLIKIIMNHFQTLALIFDMPVKWPFEINTLQILPIFISTPLTHGLSFQCFLRNAFPETLNNYPTHFFKLIYNWIHPVILVLICLIYLKIYSKYANNDYIRKLTNENFIIYFRKLIQPLYCIILMIYYCEGIQIVLQTFSCINVGYIDNPHYVMRQDVSVSCWNDFHNTYSYKVALPFGIIYGICFPLTIFLLLLKQYKRGKLDRKNMLFKYGYFYYGLEQHYFFWDFLILIRKFLIIALGIFYLSDYEKPKNYMLLIAFLILAIALYIQIYFKPYRHDKVNIINDLELKSLISLVGSIFTGIFCLELIESNEDSSNSNLLIMIGIITFNLYFLIFWIYAFVIYNLKFVYEAARKFLAEYAEKYFKVCFNKEIIISDNILKQISFYENGSPRRKRVKTQLGQFLLDKNQNQNNIESSNIEMKNLANPAEDSINIFQDPYKELKTSPIIKENQNDETDIKPSNNLNLVSQNEAFVNRRRGGRTLDTDEKKFIKRRLLFNQNDYDEILIEKFKKDSFLDESNVFILESNDMELSQNVKNLIKNINISFKTSKPKETSLDIKMILHNDNSTEVGPIEVEIENNPEIDFKTKPDLNIQMIRPYSEFEWDITVKYIQFPYNVVLCKLKMNLLNSCRVIVFPLPHTLNKYIDYQSISLKIFKKSWKILCSKAAILGPFGNERLLFSNKEEMKEMFKNKIVEYEIPYYRREGMTIAQEKYGCLIQLIPEQKKYLLKIKRNQTDTQFEFCSLDHNSEKPWQDFYFYEVLTYLMMKE